MQAVTWGLAELGLPRERLDYGHVHGGTDTPEFRAMNPNGLVPVLRDAPLTLFEKLPRSCATSPAATPAPFRPECPARPRPGGLLGGMGQDHLRPRLHWTDLLGRSSLPAGGATPRRSRAPWRRIDRNAAILEEFARDIAWATGADFTLPTS